MAPAFAAKGAEWVLSEPSRAHMASTMLATALRRSSRNSFVSGPNWCRTRSSNTTSLLVLVPVVAQGVLSDSTPNQRLSLCVVQTNNHGRFYILFGSDAAHSAANPAHAPRAIGGLLSLAPTGGEDQVGILVLHHLLHALALHGSLDVLLRNLRQDRVPDLVGVVRAPGVGVVL